MTLTATDLFCGAGGSSLGAELAGVELVMAANHWPIAIDVHQANFPQAGHDCADISQADPRRYPRTDMLLASPECFTAGHLVTTANGQVPIEDVQVDDVVLTHLNRWRPVVRVQRRQADTVIVKGQGHTGIETTANHRFWARTSRTEWQADIRQRRRIYESPGWVTAAGPGGLEDRGALWCTPTYVEHLPPLSPPPVFGTDSAAAWWLVGRWVGDGSLTFGRDHEVLISCGFHEELELAERLSDTGHGWAPDQKRTAVVFRTGDRDARNWLDEHFGHGAAGKGLPSRVLSLPRADRQALLDGYMSADGHNTDRRARCSTVSRRLAISIRLLAESLGHRVAMAHDKRITYNIEGRTGSALMQWILHWELTLHPTRSPEAFERDGMAWSRVRSVTPGRSNVTVYNLEVADDHSYVLDGIVVANCTNHSNAKGVSRKAQNPNLFDSADLGAERSRATMWDVPRFVEAHRYDAVVVENVVDAFVGWIYRRSWWQTWEDAGYEAVVVNLNSAHTGRVHQWRDRVYIVAVRKGLVDLAALRELVTPRPPSWCAACEAVVAGVQTFKKPGAPGTQIGKWRAQYVYRCPTCNGVVDPPAPPAAAVIDWTLPAGRIGDRARPLAANTLERIRRGLAKYGPHLLAGQGNTWDGVNTGSGYLRAWPLTDPTPVRACRYQHAIAHPPAFMLSGKGRSDGAEDGRVRSVDQPVFTMTAGGGQASVVIGPDGLYVPLRRNATARPASEAPLQTVAANGGHHGLVMAPQSDGRALPTSGPNPSMTTKGTAHLIVPYYGNSEARPDTDPHGTVTTRDREAVVSVQLEVDDCHYRMLDAHEVQAAMAFPADYALPGEITKGNKVKLWGNAVTPPVMTDIVGPLRQLIEAT